MAEKTFAAVAKQVGRHRWESLSGECHRDVTTLRVVQDQQINIELFVTYGSAFMDILVLIYLSNLINIKTFAKSSNSELLVLLLIFSYFFCSITKPWAKV